MSPGDYETSQKVCKVHRVNDNHRQSIPLCFIHMHFQYTHYDNTMSFMLEGIDLYTQPCSAPFPQMESLTYHTIVLT